MTRATSLLLAMFMLVSTGCAPVTGKLIPGAKAGGTKLGSKPGTKSKKPAAPQPVSTAPAPVTNTHLLLTEIVTTPAQAAYIEIYNPTTYDLFLDDYYLTDGNSAKARQRYYNLVTGADYGGGNSSSDDFHVTFPRGSMILAGAYLSIAVDSDGFLAAYGQDPDFELTQDGWTDGVEDMAPVNNGDIGSAVALDPDGEGVVLYYWDWYSDLVEDVDYVLYGKCDDSAVSKTRVSVDGPDSDGTATGFQKETRVSAQVRAAAPASGYALARIDIAEGSEARGNGNGVTGDDETSEPLDQTWDATLQPTPGGP